MTLPSNLIYLSNLRDRTGCFRDRSHAGDVLVELLYEHVLCDPGRRAPIILGIPCGGVEVAAAMSHHAQAPVDVAPVAEITAPWSDEAVLGAVAFDGCTRLNRNLIRAAGLSAATIEQRAEIARHELAEMVTRLRKTPNRFDFDDRLAIVVDDGTTSSFALISVLAALAYSGAGRLVLALPTAHESALPLLAGTVDRVICANLRTDAADDGFRPEAAYQHWHRSDLEEAERVLESIDEVGEASLESFPASDPPAWTPGPGIG